MHTHTFPSGLRLLCIKTDRPTVYCGIILNAGTRHENTPENGMAHCVEHMTFKGTHRRTAMQILNRMESVGGEVNAFTTKQETVYYSICLRKHLGRALDFLTDIVFHSNYPQEELDREVEVIIDEIESYNDNPSELIYDDFESLLFADNPLGRSILGDAETLRTYTSADLDAFARRLYVPNRAVLFVMGDVHIDQVISLLSKCDMPLSTPSLQMKKKTFPGGSSSPQVQTTPSLQGRAGGGSASSIIRQKGTHQAHVVIGCPSVPLSDDRFMGLFLLNNILGGASMNSRLNISLRERRGLVYNVGSSLIGYSDTGVWSAWLGCDAGDIDKCIRIVKTELRRLADKPLSDRALRAAVRQMKGQMALSHDNFESVAIGTAKRFLHTGHALTLEDMFHQLDILTPDYLHTLAGTYLCPDNMFTLIYK